MQRFDVGQGAVAEMFRGVGNEKVLRAFSVMMLVLWVNLPVRDKAASAILLIRDETKVHWLEDSVAVVERGPTYFTCLLQIPVYQHSGIYSPILPLEEGYRIQAFSRYPYLVQQLCTSEASVPLPGGFKTPMDELLALSSMAFRVTLQ